MNFRYFTSFSVIFIVYNLFIAVLVIRTNSQEQQCICNAKFVGEYCGSELGAGNCSKELIYFCGKSNLRRQAFALRACTEKGYECSTKAQKDNPCFQNLHCSCGEDHRRRKKYCGSDLQGGGCKPNIIYKCPLFRGNKLQVEDACPKGCKDGRCV